MNLAGFAYKSGKLPRTVGLPWEYFQKRGCVLDCRGPLVIDESSRWGFGVRVITQSHAIDGGPGTLGHVKPYPVIVESGVWVGSFSILTGCTIGSGAIVAAGAIVRGQMVRPGVMVAGNPARVIARWLGGRWQYVPEYESGFYRILE